MYDHTNDWVNAHTSRLKQLHEDFLAKYDAIQYAQIEGVFECTLRSTSQTVTVGIGGDEIAQILIEYLSRKLDNIEDRMTYHQAEFVEEMNEAPQLAQQAAATAAPAQKGPGRPRKAAKPKPELMEAVGVMASQVPMNIGTGTGNAAARATGTMPQG
jgi:hypothetical protein